MKPLHDEAIHFRLPSDLMRDLNGAARASGSGLSSTARRALVLGLRALRSSDGRDPPPPSAPAASMPVAA